MNLQIRASNAAASTFYRRLGYQVDDVISMGKRLVDDSDLDAVVNFSLSERPDLAPEARRLVEQYVRLPDAWERHGGVPDQLPKSFGAEIDDLPGALVPPCGDVVVAPIRQVGIGVGCIAPLDDDRCDFKRVYVTDAHCGSGVGSLLVTAHIATASGPSAPLLIGT